MDADGRRRSILRALAAQDAPLTVAQVAERLDERPTTVRFHLDALVEDGLVERTSLARVGPGRPPVGYRSVRTLRGDGSANYRLLAAILVDAMSEAAPGDRAAQLVDTGRRWGSALAETSDAENVTEVLDALGFDPDPVTEEGEIVLRHCPFFDLAATSREIVCPVHLGLLHGAADTLEPGTTVHDLLPFVAPDACVAHLTRHAS